MPRAKPRGTCCRCKKLIWTRDFVAWTEDDRTMMAHRGCRPPGTYRSPAEVFAERYNRKGRDDAG